MRKQNWQHLLDDHITAHQSTAFDWQTNNCTTFAAAWVTIATGLMTDAPTTRSARPALRAVRDMGGLRVNATRHLGDPLPGAFAQCGDVVLLKTPRSRGRVAYAFGVCLGAVCAAPSATGLMMLPITEAEAAWRV